MSIFKDNLNAFFKQVHLYKNDSQFDRITAHVKEKIYFLTPSLISPSFQGGPTIFHKGIFPKQTPCINYPFQMLHNLWFSMPIWLALLPPLGYASCRQTSKKTGMLNQIRCKIRKRETKRGGGGAIICYKKMAALQSHKCMA